MSRFVRLGPTSLATLAGALYAASFAPFELPWLAWVALAPLILAIRDVSCPRAFALGWWAGTIAFTSLVSHSVYEASTHYFSPSPSTSFLFSLVAPQLYGAPYVGLFALLARAIQRRHAPGAVSSLLVASAWVASELARSRVGHGAPWLLLAQSQHAWLPVLQISDLTGAAGVSFVVALVNTAVVALVDSARERTAQAKVAQSFGCTAAVVGAVLGYGVYQLERWSPQQAPRLRVALVQGNLPLLWRQAIREVAPALRRMHDLTKQAMRDRPNLVVWPENAVGFALAGNESWLSTLSDSLGDETLLLLGAPRAVTGPSGETSFRNSAFLVDGRGRIRGVYDKNRLTPYAEYTPLRGVFPLRQRFATRDRYSPGAAAPPLEASGHLIGILICSEAIYSDLARHLTLTGAELLINISNDAWFGSQAAVEQHARAATLRAVENRRYLLRATNTGVTMIVDPRGARIATAPPAEPAVLTGAVEPLRELTLYARIGDFFGWLCVALTVIGALRRARPPR